VIDRARFAGLDFYSPAQMVIFAPSRAPVLSKNLNKLHQLLQKKQLFGDTICVEVRRSLAPILVVGKISIKVPSRFLSTHLARTTMIVTTSRRKSLLQNETPAATRWKPDISIQKAFGRVSWRLSQFSSGWARSVSLVSKNLRASMKSVILAVLGLLAPPLLMLGHIPTWNPISLIQEVVVIWTALLRCTITVSIVASICGAFLIANDPVDNNSNNNSSSTNNNTKTRNPAAKIIRCAKANNLQLPLMALVIGPLLVASSIGQSQLQLGFSSWIWHPLLWGRYNVYLPNSIAPALQGMCLELDPNDSRPLCLPEKSWRVLSADRLDSNNPDDVQSVMKGIKYARDVSGGIIINVMCRDSVNEIPSLRQNVEGLLPFFKDKVAVVIFENDSDDGSREAFKQWAKDAVGYKVDLISCGEDNPDCRFHISHRYEATEVDDYFQSSAIGKMAEFRQKIVDHIVADESYNDFSHMIVFDMDLGVSLSPFGILHTLGNIPEETVASSGRSVFPGSFGSIIKPYDMSAFRPVETHFNQNLMRLHQYFCELLPPGDRWRNQCDALSPMMLAVMLRHDWFSGSQPYEVKSAFNGAVLYPLKLLRSKNPKYNWGEDGQQCEHISFNLDLDRPMYVNPKWDMHLTLENPGGPLGYRALRIAARIASMPKLSMAIGGQVILCTILVVWCFLVLAHHLVMPFFFMLSDSFNNKTSNKQLDEKKKHELEVYWGESDSDDYDSDYSPVSTIDVSRTSSFSRKNSVHDIKLV
jgi:hypothetical protein